MGYQAPYPHAVTSRVSKNGIVLVAATDKTPANQIFKADEAMALAKAMAASKAQVTRLALWLPNTPASVTGEGKNGKLYELAYGAEQIAALDLSNKVAYLTYNKFGGPHLRIGDPQANKPASAPASAPLTR